MIASPSKYFAHRNFHQISHSNREATLKQLAALLLVCVMSACSDSTDRIDSEVSPDTLLAELFTCPVTTANSTSAPLPEFLNEISGAIFSRTNPDIIWVHNDSGDDPTIYALNLEGELIAEISLAGIIARDWEDIAIGPKPDGGWYIYIGDIGDNQRARDAIQIYRIVEPDLAGIQPGFQDTVVDVDTFNLHYPDMVQDAESLMVDPNTGQLYIVAKSPLFMPTTPSFVYRVPSDLGNNSTTVMEFVIDVSFSAFPSVNSDDFAAFNPILGPELVTAAEIISDGSVIGVRTYAGIFAWTRNEDQTIGEALAQPPCEIPVVREDQGETFAFSEDGTRYITISEKFPIVLAELGVAEPVIHIYELQ